MANFLAELKRRHIYRVAAAYAVIAWVLLQVVNNVAPVMNAPSWVAQSALLFLALGFPLSVFLAWTREPPASNAAIVQGTTIADFALVGVLVAVLGAVSYQQFASPRTTVTANAQAGVEAARAAAASLRDGISIAVLPFENLSGDVSQEFFSDGMTQEIVAALAKIPDLRVVARGSASQFKGERKGLRSVGQALGATHLIEGSVRKSGDRVRITAQLVKADDEVNVWVSSYDREMKDIFAVQEDIAEAIAGALRVPLGLKPGQFLVSNRAIGSDSYQQYLRAKALVRTRGLANLTGATALLEQVADRDPDFAPAWALLALAIDLTPRFDPAYRNGSKDELRLVAQASLPKAEAAARRAIQLDANLADGYVSLGGVQMRRGKFLLTEELYSKALALDPNNPDTLHRYSQVLAAAGRLKEALAMRQRLQALEPFVPVFNGDTAQLLWLNEQNDAAITILRDLPRDDANRALFLGWIYASAGRYTEAADAVMEIPPGAFLPGIVEEAARLLRTAPATMTSPQTLPRLGILNFVYPHIGALSRGLEFSEDNVEVGYMVVSSIYPLWHPSYAPVRKTERFKAFAREAGLVAYWRVRGWPDLCHPTTGDDFACE